MRLDDFIGFEWNGHHSSEFNILAVSNGSRYDSRFLADITNNTVDIPGTDGAYFYNSTFGPKKWTINIAFDSVTEVQVREIEEWLGSKELSDLTFDERPYKTYSAKLESRPSITWLCFNEDWTTGDERAPRIYKGEGTLNFIAPFPFAKSVILADGSYLKFRNQFRFKKNIYKDPTDDLLVIYNNSGGYTNRNTSERIVEFNSFYTDASRGDLNLLKGSSLTFKNGDNEIEFKNGSDKDLVFYSFSDSKGNLYRNSIVFNKVTDKYEFVQQVNNYSITLNKEGLTTCNVSVNDKVLAPQDSSDYSDYFSYDSNIITDLRYRVDEKTGYVNRFILTTTQSVSEVDLKVRTDSTVIYSFNNELIYYNLYSGDSITLVYKANNNLENSIQKIFGLSVYETLYYNLDEWIESSKIVDDKGYNYPVLTDNRYVYDIVNSGQMDCPFKLTIPLKKLSINDEINVILTEDNDIGDNSIEVINYLDFNTGMKYYKDDIEYYLMNKRIENNIFKLYFCDSDGNTQAAIESTTGVFDGYTCKTYNNSINVINKFVLGFDDSLVDEYQTILNTFSQNSKLIIDTNKQIVDLEITTAAGKQLIPMSCLIKYGDLFKIPKSKIEFNSDEDYYVGEKVDNYKILVYTNNDGIINESITGEELKYRYLYY